ncbi:MAG: hypothetical protein LBQ16_06610, partial [Gracilibacteraceae bacterium]|nr:hypothetical protein [Gracilibacteraceae bacterium]
KAERRSPGRPRGALLEDEKDLTERPVEFRGIQANVKLVTINQKMRDAYVASLAGADGGVTIEEMVEPEQAKELRRLGPETEENG